METISKEIGETYHNVSAIVRARVSPERLKAEYFLRKSRSKLGDNSPMKGRTGEKHPNWKGICSDNKGYYTKIVDGVRYFLHRIVMAQALGIHPKDLPATLTIHHIDGNLANNSLDNLALCSNAGHRQLHRQWKELRVSPTWERWKLMISQLKETNHL